MRHPFKFGDWVRLNSGGPDMLIVDIDGSLLTVAWADAEGLVHERTFERVCVHDARDLPPSDSG